MPVWDIDYLILDQARSLAEFAKAEGLWQAEVNTLARLTGRGYRPPVTVEGWSEVWSWVKPIMEKIEEESRGNSQQAGT